MSYWAFRIGGCLRPATAVARLSLEALPSCRCFSLAPPRSPLPKTLRTTFPLPRGFRARRLSWQSRSAPLCTSASATLSSPHLEYEDEREEDGTPYIKKGLSSAAYTRTRARKRALAPYHRRIADLAEAGRLEEGLEVIQEMVEEDVPPTLGSFLPLFRAASNNSEDGIHDWFQVMQRMKEVATEQREREGSPRIILNAIPFNFFLKACLRQQNVPKDKESLALQVIEQMRAAGIKPDAHTFATLIESCCNTLPSLPTAFAFYQRMLQEHILPDSNFFHALLSCCSKAGEGAWPYTERTWQLMKQHSIRPDLLTYNVLLACCVRENRFEEAFRTFDEMKREGFHPDDYTYSALIKACEKVGQPERGAEFLSLMQEGGVRATVTTYNTLLHGYCSAGEFEEAFALLQQMKAQGLRPNAATFNGMIKGFAPSSASSASSIDQLDDVEEDEELESVEPITRGQQRNILEEADTLNRIIQEMAEAGVTPDSQLYYPLISALTKQKGFNAGLEVYLQMRQQRISPNFNIIHTLVLSCDESEGTAAALKLYRSLLQDAYSKQEVNTLLLNSLISKLMAAKREESAVGVLQWMKEEAENGKKNVAPNTYTYDILLRTATTSNRKEQKCGNANRRKQYQQRLEEAVQYGYQLMQEMKDRGIKNVPDVPFMDVFVRALCRCGKMEEAHRWLEDNGENGDRTPTAYVYASLIQASNSVEQGIELLDEMKNKGIRPDTVVFNSLISLCGRRGRKEIDKDENDERGASDAKGDAGKGGGKGAQLAMELWRQMQKEWNIQPDPSTYFALVKTLCDHNLTTQALRILNSMYTSNSSSSSTNSSFDITSIYNVLLTALLRAGRYPLAQHLLHEMQHRNVPFDIYTYTTQIDLFAATASKTNENMEEALETVKHMRERMWIKPDLYVYSSLVSACRRCGRTDLIWKLTRMMAEDGLQPDLPLYNNLLAAYTSPPPSSSSPSSSTGSDFGKTQQQQDQRVEKLLQQMKAQGIRPNVITYNILISAATSSSSSSCMKRAYELFREMKEKAKLQPNERTMLALMTGHQRFGDVEGAFALFRRMRDEEGIIPTLPIYTTLLSACDKAGQLDKAMQVLQLMKREEGGPEEDGKERRKRREESVKPDLVMFNMLIRAFAKENNVESCLGLLEEMHRSDVQPDANSFNPIVSALTRNDQLDKALSLVLEKMMGLKMEDGMIQKLRKKIETEHEKITQTTFKAKPNAATFGLLLSGCSKAGRVKEAIALMEVMKLLDVQPDSIRPFNDLLISCVSLSSSPSSSPTTGSSWLEQGLDIVNRMKELKLKLSVVTLQQLVSLCQRDSNIEALYQLLERFRVEERIRPDAPCYNSIFKTLAYQPARSDKERQAKKQKVLELLSRMRHEDNIPPNIHIYNTLIQTLARSDGEEEAVELFREMRKELGAEVELNPRAAEALRHACKATSGRHADVLALLSPASSSSSSSVSSLRSSGGGKKFRTT
ncbi:Pentatricopeptide repeat-containing protein 1, mitochondrial [Balamuthia mandrillaris]